MSWHKQSDGCYQQVTRKFHEEVSEALLLEMASGTTLTTTPRQRFYLPNVNKFSSARQLQPYATLQTADGREVKLQAVKGPSQAEASPWDVFNLEVESAHTYFVGDDSVLVHNKKVIDGPEEPPGGVPT